MSENKLTEKTRPIVVERYADNGEHSHWELIEPTDHAVLWSQETIEGKQQAISDILMSKGFKGMRPVRDFNLACLAAYDFADQQTAHLIRKLGLAEIEMSQKTNLLKQCEAALEYRDSQISSLQKELHEAKCHASALADMCDDAHLQIEYLHNKFQETGSGNNVLSRLRAAVNNFNTWKEGNK